ncbi:26S proteasome non-ATPase regulatory subunit 8 [Balamuthia mandrillaris]
MASIGEVTQKFNAFRDEVKSSNTSLEEASQMLTDLKILMTNFTFLLPGKDVSPEALREAFISREILEHAVLLSVKQRDPASFERHLAQLKTYYDSNRFKDLPPSPLQYTILGLNLLRLLALNRISDFHTELELIPVEQHENVYIKHPVMLEQYIMEGSYNKVFEAAKDVPSDTYSFFMEYLLETRLKDEIAECSEKAYESLSVKAAQELLHFRDSESLLSYATERGWEVVGDTINLQKKKEELPQIPSINVIGQTLAYAKELERIV